MIAPSGLVKRCAGCNKSFPVESYPAKHIATMKDGSTKVKREPMCDTCRSESKHEAAKVLRTIRRTGVVRPGTDFSLVAEQMVSPDVPYMDCSKETREHIVALAFMLASKYHPETKARRQMKPPVEGPARTAATVTLMQFEATDSIPFEYGSPARKTADCIDESQAHDAPTEGGSNG